MQKSMVIIGAGSAMFTQGLVMDLIQKKPGNCDWHLKLCDIDPEVLDGIVKLVKKMLVEKQTDIKLSWSTDRCDLLPGADYVIATIGVGGRRAAEQDVFIPRKYGIFQPVGDTTMPGGISRAMRMVPAMVDIARDIRRLAPNARFFNYSNPMAIICRALRKALDIDVTGLCIGTVSSEWYIADFMGYPRERVTTLAAGINHCTFIYDYRLDGQEMKDEIRKKVLSICKDSTGLTIGSQSLAEKADDRISRMGKPFSWEFFLQYGAFPAPGDRHVTEFFTELFPGGAYYGKQLGIDVFPFERSIASGDRIHQEAMRLAHTDAPLGEEFFKHFHGEHEQLMDIIDSMEKDRRSIFYMNVLNTGAVPNLPPYAVLEIPCVATANGVRSVRMDDFPDILAAFTMRFLSGIELAVDAALTGNRKIMEEAILLGGYISDRKAVSAMVDELLTAHRDYLPQFQ